jgi:hypothetical protein
VARRLGQPDYIFQCTMDTRPEDLIVTPVLTPDRRVEYHASSLVSAMLTGGIAILDEGNRMPERAWASLAPLMDDRRYVESSSRWSKCPHIRSSGCGHDESGRERVRASRVHPEPTQAEDRDRRTAVGDAGADSPG